ncbi:MAG: hypothetical protein KGV59_06250 [Tenacibaculum sp.]|nr:hypothetical protein [Tenacibaculum sp.]
MNKLLEIVKTPQNTGQEFDYRKFIVSNEKINKEVDDFLTGRIQQGFTIGISELDDYFVCKKNEFYILTGKKGMGKTTINQALQVMHSIANNLIWVVAFQENSYWSMRLNYLNYLIGGFAKDCKNNDPELWKKANKWVDEHFIFIDVEDIKTATEVTKKIIDNGTDVHALLLDPINSFRNGWQDTGNGYADGVVAGMELLKFSQKYCSVHISQHPNMSGQRQDGAVTSYQGEGGWFLNKASFTYVIHRKKGSNENELIVENVRNKHTGGGETEFENPVVLYWHPTRIDIGMRMMSDSTIQTDVIGMLRRIHNPLKEEIRELNKELPKSSINDAFGVDNEVLF